VPRPQPPFEERYLAGEFAGFFELAPHQFDVALDRTRSVPRQELAAALSEDAGRLGAPAGTWRSLERLRHENSRVVVTGQQPGLLLGPAYTLSKALAAISLARELDEPDRPVIPVFWVASQDHDVAEMDHTYLFDLEERLHRVGVDLPEGAPVGHAPLRQEHLSALCLAIEQCSFPREHKQEVYRLLDEAGEKARSYPDLFSAILYRLLGDEGLVILDPLRPAVAPLFRDVLAREIGAPSVTTRAINDAAVSLRQVGAQPQLGRGVDATNLFITEGNDGEYSRQLLRFDGKAFQSRSREYGREELLRLLDSEPWRITPAAGLRPVTQDSVLPTAAFVVGPGELRYIAQLRGVYEFHGVPMPVVWPRAQTVVLEPPTRRILARYGISYDEYLRDRDDLGRRVLLERHGKKEQFERALARLEREFAELLDSVEGIDPTLKGTVIKSQSRLEATVEVLRNKTAQALAANDRTTSRQFERLEGQLFPSGVPQERQLTVFSFFLKFGVEPMMHRYRQVGPGGLHIIEP